MADPLEDIRNALVAREGHRHLYEHSPTFYSAINQLAGMLPAMVSGLAVEAQEVDANLQAALDKAMASTPVSLRQLSEELGWPDPGGDLSDLPRPEEDWEDDG